MHILLAEDEPELANWLCRALHQNGYQVDWIDDGRLVENGLRQVKYDALILDLGLPGMDGHTVLARLRRSDARLPVLILTAQDSVAERVSTLKGGADDFVAKPFSIDELEARLIALIRRSRGSEHPRMAGPLLVAKGRFDPLNDFSPIGLVGIAPQLLVHRPSLQIASIPELIKYAKANPGKLTFASSGNGSVQHVAGEAFKLAAGVEMLHVPFKGTGEAMTSLLSGDVDLSFSSAASVVQNINTNKLKLLATCTPKRLANYPEVPTIAETLRGYEVSTWYGLAGPAKLPQEIVTRLNSEINAIIQLPDVAKRFKDLSEELGSGTPEQFRQFWRSELDKYAKLIKDAKIQST